MKKILALLLAVVMVVSLFAGCGSSQKAPETEAQGAAPAETQAQAPATSGEVPELVWYMVGNGMPTNYDSWKAQINAYLEEKIGVHLDIQCIGWGDWGNVQSVMLQTNGDYDMIFMDAGQYYSSIEMGALADLAPYLESVPGLTDLIPQMYLDACMVDGGLYAIPAYKDSSMTDFFVWSKDSVEAYFPEYADAHTLAEAYEGLKKINEATGEIWGNAGGIGTFDCHTHDNVGLGRCGIGISLDGGTEFVSIYEDESLVSLYRILHQMYNDGLINSDANVLDGEYDGPTVVGTAQGWPSAGVTVWGPNRGEEVVTVQYEQTVVSNSTIMGSLTAVNASSPYVAECVKLIELVNTDSYVRDLLGYGEEGVNWEYVEAYGEQRVHKLNTDWTFAAYTQGTFFNWTLTDDVETNYWVEEVQVQNENAVASPALGFVVDTTAIADDVAALCAIVESYFRVFATGAGDPDVILPAMMEELRASNFDAVLEEVNRQYAEWLANK